MAAALGWFKLSKVVVRTSDSFVQKTNYLPIWKGWSSSKFSVTSLDPRYLSIPKEFHLPRCGYAGCCIPKWDSELFGKCSTDRILKPHTPRKDRSKQFGAKGTPATYTVPVWDEFWREPLALIQKGHHTFPGPGGRAGVCSCTPFCKPYSQGHLPMRQEHPLQKTKSLYVSKAGWKQFSACWRQKHQLSSQTIQTGTD